MRGGRRIARRGGSAVNPRRDRLALFGRARGCTSWAVRFDSWERRGGGWYGQWWPVALALALAVSVLRVVQRVGVSPRLASRSCFADTHTAWLVRLRHHHEGSCRVAVLYVLCWCLWAGLPQYGAFHELD